MAPLFGQPGWFSALLRLRGIDTDEKARAFLSPSLDDLHDPLRMHDMEKIVSMLRKAAADGTKILVWGDYDADGVCAASILVETLRAIGADADYRLPSRHSEGYGLNEAGIRDAAGTYGLLITVDCGISNHAEVALAKELGMAVIVTDHHALPPELPAADAVTSPLLDGYPCQHLCGAGVALKICQALRGMPGILEELDLAAIATVADVVPLSGENRVIVREGLNRIAETNRPGLKALMRAAEVEPPVKADQLAFRIGPRLNAAGRLEDAALAAELLQTRDPARGAELAGKLNSLNARRQGLEKQMTDAALVQVHTPGIPNPHSLVVAAEGWDPGLIGLTAGRLCQRYHLPAVALSLQGDEAVGSCRSIPGVHIFEMLGKCADLLERFGGHEQAAGLSLKRERVGAFRARLEQVIRESCDPRCFEPCQEYDLSLPFRTWSPAVLKKLDDLEPTGCGNPPPVFLLSGVSVQSMRRVGKDMSHLQVTLLDEDTFLKGIGFSMGAAADTGWSDVDILYRPILNEFRGRTSVEAQISALRPHV